MEMNHSAVILGGGAEW